MSYNIKHSLCHKTNSFLLLHAHAASCGTIYSEHIHVTLHSAQVEVSRYVMLNNLSFRSTTMSPLSSTWYSPKLDMLQTHI